MGPGLRAEAAVVRQPGEVWADTAAIRKAVLRLALPIVGSNLLQRGVGIVDTLMVGRLGATKVAGEGQEGEVGIVLTVVRRRDVPGALRLIETLDPDAFVGVEDERTVYRGQFIRQTRR